MKIKPLDDWVLAERELGRRETESGLFLPEGARFKLEVGTVRAVGPKASDVEDGEHILFDRYAGEDVSSSSAFPDADPERYVLLRQSEILAIDTTGVMTPVSATID